MSKKQDLLTRKDINRLFAEVAAKDKAPLQPMMPAIHVTQCEIAVRENQEPKIVHDEEYWIPFS